MPVVKKYINNAHYYYGYKNQFACYNYSCKYMGLIFLSGSKTKDGVSTGNFLLLSIKMIRSQCSCLNATIYDFTPGIHIQNIKKKNVGLIFI